MSPRLGTHLARGSIRHNAITFTAEFIIIVYAYNYVLFLTKHTLTFFELHYFITLLFYGAGNPPPT